ncbi:MAG: FAD-binding oxidoreductase, partial [Acidobacteriaceae bacterium]|nr:FAD-binding oxidoreductase [Acidobacteriaceae bacterium]
NITWKPTPDHDEAVLYAFQTVSRLEHEYRQTTGWLETGRFFLSSSEPTRQAFSRFDEAAKKRGIAARWLEPDEARARNPLLDPLSVNGIWFNPLSGRINPADLTSAYVAAARSKGADIREGVEVVSVAHKNARVVGVETSGGFIGADKIVVAAGIWSRALLQPLGIALAQWPCEHMYTIAEVSPRLARETPSFVMPDHLIYGREEVGKFLVGFFDENAKTLDPGSLPKPFSFTLLAPDWDKVAPYFMAAARVFPSLENAPVRSFINGPESFTPDGSPLIGQLSSIANLYVATAMNSAGVTWSAMSGCLIADLLGEKTSRFDVVRYDPNRFAQRGSDRDWLTAQVSSTVSAGYRRHNR